MNTIVTKFGGSSLADSIHFKKVKNIIEGNSERKYVVPSAPGKRFSKDFKVTDLLYLCHAHVNSGISLDDVFKLISERYHSIVNELDLNFDLNSHLEIIKKDIENGASVDYAASKGELQSVKKAVGLENLINKNSKDYKKLNMDKIRGAETREDMLLKNPTLYVTPIVRNGKEATVGNAPETWKEWEKAK